MTFLNRCRPQTSRIESLSLNDMAMTNSFLDQYQGNSPLTPKFQTPPISPMDLDGLPRSMYSPHSSHAPKVAPSHVQCRVASYCGSNVAELSKVSFLAEGGVALCCPPTPHPPTDQLSFVIPRLSTFDISSPNVDYPKMLKVTVSGDLW